MQEQEDNLWMQRASMIEKIPSMTIICLTLYVIVLLVVGQERDKECVIEIGYNQFTTSQTDLDLKTGQQTARSAAVLQCLLIEGTLHAYWLTL